MSGLCRIMPDSGATGSASEPATGSAFFIGKIETITGTCTLTRPGGIPVQITVGDPLFQGDIIETAAGGSVGICFTDGTTFNLSDSARMVLTQYAHEQASALFNITRGTFAFVAGKMAKAGRLDIDTPFASIRGRSRVGGIGMLSLASLFFAALEDVQAAPSDVAFLDDGVITFKDLEHGIFELTTHEIIPRHYVVDDPETTLVLRWNGSSVSQSTITNSFAQMEQFQSAQQDVLHTFEKGFQGPTAQGPSGSGGPGDLPVIPITFVPPPDPGAPPVIFPVIGGGSSGPSIPPVIFIPPPPPPPPPDVAPILALDQIGNLPDTYVVNGLGVTITGAASLITDPDSPNMQSATITLTNHQANDLLSVKGSLPSGITASSYNAATGVLTLAGSATPDAYEAAFHQIVFSNSSNNPDLSDRTISVVVNDGVINSNTATATIHVSAFDQAPVAVDDHVITNIGLNTGIAIPYLALLANDTDVDTPHDQLAVLPFGFQNAVGGTTNAGSDSVIFTITDPNGGSFNYAVTDGTLNSAAKVIAVQTTSGDLNGTNGADILIGKAGGSVMNGNGGNDVLVGNTGADKMTGGAGNDTFVFMALTDSKPGAGNFDTIIDFTHNSDHIDLSAIAGATNVQGAVGAANTVAANSISWFVDNAHNETILYVNATAAANHVDMEIHLTGTNINLTGSDILHHT